MSSKTILMPALSETGWESAPARVADYLFSHFFESDYSQTQLYNGKVSSLAWILVQEMDNQTELMLLIRNTLQTYFGRYFDPVTVEVNIIDDPKDGAKSILTIYLAFTGADGVEYNLSTVVNTSGSKILSVIKSNNFGT